MQTASPCGVVSLIRSPRSTRVGYCQRLISHVWKDMTVYRADQRGVQLSDLTADVRAIQYSRYRDVFIQVSSTTQDRTIRQNLGVLHRAAWSPDVDRQV